MTASEEKVNLPIEFLRGEAKFLLGHLLANSDDLIYLILIENKEFVFINKRFEEVLGYSIDELRSEEFNFFDIISSKSVELIKARDERRERGEKVENELRFWAKAKDGRDIPFNTSLIELEWRGKPAILGIARDMTLETEHLNHLKETIEINQIILDNIPTGIVLLDRFLKFRYINSKAQEYFGKSNSELLGSLFLDFVDDDVRRTIKEFAGTNDSRVHKSPITFTQRNSQPRYFQWYFASIEQGNEVVLFQAIIVDMTETIMKQKELETKNNKLIEANMNLEALNQRLEEFVTVTSHDLKAPARRIATFGTLIQNEFKLNPKAQEHMKILVETSKHLVSMIDAFVNYSRLDIRELNLQMFEMDKIIDYVISMSLKEIVTNSNAKIKVSKPIPKVYGDYKLFTQVWQNLIQNAIKFCKRDTKPIIEIWGERENEHLTFYCKDNGLGVPEDKKEFIFEMFKRIHETDIPGTGIGLSIVKKVIDMHGGKIWIKDNDDGEGTTFIFTLPLPPPSS